MQRPAGTHRIVLTALVIMALPACSPGCAPPYRGAHRADVTFLVFHPDGATTDLDVEVLDPARAAKIASAITGQSPVQTDCGYSGRLYLQKDDVSVFDEPAQINLHPDCAHIVFTIDGETTKRTLQGEGLQILRQLYADHVPRGQRLAY